MSSRFGYVPFSQAALLGGAGGGVGGAIDITGENIKPATVSATGDIETAGNFIANSGTVFAATAQIDDIDALTVTINQKLDANDASFGGDVDVVGALAAARIDATDGSFSGDVDVTGTITAGFGDFSGYTGTAGAATTFTSNRIEMNVADSSINFVAAGSINFDGSCDITSSAAMQINPNALGFFGVTPQTQIPAPALIGGGATAAGNAATINDIIIRLTNYGLFS